MMDWTKQMEEMAQNMTKGWTDVQKQMVDAQKQVWSSFSGAAEQMTGGQVDTMWRQTLTNWQQMVDKSLETQGDVMATWMDNLQSAGMPEPMAAWAEQMRAITKNWTAAQQQMWDNWFQMVGKMEPTLDATTMNAAAETMMKQWQEMTQNMLQTQQEWLKNWGNMFGQAK